jgi:hypothetical protein
MAFQDLDSNFHEKVSKMNSGEPQQTSPELDHYKQTQPETDKVKYENDMGSSLKKGLLSMFQSQLSKVQNSSNEESYRTINVTSEDIAPMTQPTPQSQVSPQQIDSLLNNQNQQIKQTKPVVNEESKVTIRPIEDNIPKDNIKIVSAKTQEAISNTPSVENKIASVGISRYEDRNPITEKNAKEEDAISQTAVLRQANGQPTSLGTDGKQLDDDYVRFQIQRHKEQKAAQREKGEFGDEKESKSETVISLERQEEEISFKKSKKEETGAQETILSDDDL